MPEADSEYGNLAVEVLDGIGGDAVVFERLTGSRRDDKVRWIEGDELIHRDLIIAEDFDICAEFAEILDEVVSERIVVID
jgi:hypothetical protein